MDNENYNLRGTKPVNVKEYLGINTTETAKAPGELFRMIDGIIHTIILCDNAQSRIGESLDKTGLALPWPDGTGAKNQIEFGEDTLLYQLSLVSAKARDLQERLDHHADTLSRLV